MTYIIGVDIGTGSTKAVAVDPAGKVIQTSQASYPTINPEPTHSEQAPELVWQAFVKCIARIVNGLDEKPAGIVLSSAMHSIIPVDDLGTPLMNMITWADNRSASIADRIRQSPVGESIYKQSGTPIHAMSPLCKILWIKENQSELFNRVYKFISIKEFIWNKLFDVYETDYSIASASGLFNIETRQWNTASLETCGITVNQLSSPVPTNHLRKGIKSTVKDSLNVTSDTPFIIGASDGCMANIGSFALEPGIAALTIGTSGAIRVASTTPTHNFKAMTFNYILSDDLFISGGPINNGGIALKWYAESFLKLKLDTPADYETVLGEIEKTSPGADGLIFLPYLLGERAPRWTSDASGLFFGIRNYHTQAHFTRAVVEGISMALYSIGTAMEESGLTIQRIHVSGGFIHSTTWLQILADIFNKEIVLINPEDASAVGAAFLGLKSFELIDDYDEVRPVLTKSFAPKAENHKTYQQLFSIHDRLYQKLEDEMVEIRQLSKE